MLIERLKIRVENLATWSGHSRSNLKEISPSPVPFDLLGLDKRTKTVMELTSSRLKAIFSY